MEGKGFRKYIFIVIAVAIFYFVPGRFSLALSVVRDSVTPIWPASGIALAALLVFGIRFWPAISLGSFLVNISTPGIPTPVAAGMAIGNTLEAVVGARLLQYYGFSSTLERLSDVFKLVIFASLLSTTLSASFGAASLAMGGIIEWKSFIFAWTAWWIGNSMGIMLVAPLLLTYYAIPAVHDRRFLGELILLALLLFVASNFVFQETFDYSYVLFLFVFLSALRFGPRGAAASSFLIAIVAVWRTAMGSGPFVIGTHYESLLRLNVFLSAIAVSGMTLAASLSERALVHRKLEASHRDLEERVRLRTAELSEANRELSQEVTERKIVESKLRDQTQFLEKARAEAEAAEKRSVFVADASAVLSSSLNFKNILSNLAQFLIPAVADWCVIHLVNEEGNAERVAAEGDSRNRSANIIERVLATGGPLLEQADTSNSQLPAIGVPLTSRNRIIGVIACGMNKETKTLSRADLLMVHELGRHAALSIDNAQLYSEAQQANRIKDEFLATLSHELRTPLTAILGWSRMLHAGKIDAETAERAVQSIERNAKSQSQIIDDLLDVSKIITGKLPIDPRPIDLRRIVETAVDSVCPAIEAKHISVELAGQSDPLLVKADPNRLQQVMWNLLTNAVKFTPENGSIRISIFRHNSTARVQVTDTGKGIPSRFLPHVFERFLQVDGTPSRLYGGLGLGLAIVRHLVELHGGTVEARSEGEGKGSTFTIQLPLLQDDKAMKLDDSQPVRRKLVNAPGLSGLKVLVVDDDEDTREMVVTLLRSSGARVVASGTAEEAWVLIENELPDLIICDIGLPGVSGYAFMDKIKRSISKPIPVIALTAYASSDDKKRALTGGFRAHVSKPVEPGDLLSLIANLSRRTI